MPAQTILAVTLSGGDRENEAPDAWRSVASFVDWYLLIDTGESAQKALAIAQELPETKGRNTIVKFPEVFSSESTASARNYGLAQAAAIGYDWALVLDTDERIMLHNGADVREALAGLENSVVMTRIHGGGYPKERFFRLPAKGRYSNRVHETYADGQPWAMLENVTFSEVPKTPEQMNALQLTVQRICLEEVKKDHRDSRSWMYLGNTYCHFKDFERALGAFKRGAKCARSDDEQGWLFFRAASMCHELERWEEAIELATEGMRTAAYQPELPWAAAFAEYKQKHWMLAGAWADMAIAIGETAPLLHARPIRAFCQFPIAQYEGPWQIRREVMAALGSMEQAHRAHAIVAKAEAARKAKFG